jgi:ribosomal protein L35AE/L33A
MRILELDLGFEQHDELNPLLWQGEELRSEVKMALLKIARDFVEYVGVPFKVNDLVLTGSQLGYYYTKHSDLDLHIIVDFNTVDCDREAAELFDTKRLLYKKQYDITIHGVPVEVYIEDLNFPAVSATYSLSQGSWQKKPNSQPEEINTDEILRMSKIWQTVIGKAIESNDLETGRKTIKMLRNYRKLGLKHSGEYGIENLVYKTLRNSKIIENLMKMIGDLHDRSLSIK